MHTEFPLETREIKNDESSQEFKFLIIDSPDKWPPAEQFTSSYRMPIPGVNKVIEIPVRGVSYAEWEEIEISNLYPVDEDTEENTQGVLNLKKREEYEAKKTIVEDRRKVAVFEVSTGKKIPGENAEQKLEYLNKLGSGESDALFNHILEFYSNAQDGLLLRGYEESFKSLNGKAVEVVPLKDFDDWLSASLTGYLFRMQRPFENFICEFQLRQINQAKKREIEEATKEPLPPSRPGKNPTTGQIDAAYAKYNFDDPRYKSLVRAISRKRLVMLLEAALPFELPGVSFEDKFKWISNRLVGDVSRLRIFIENEAMNYRSRFNFFMAV